MASIDKYIVTTWPNILFYLTDLNKVDPEAQKPATSTASKYRSVEECLPAVLHNFFGDMSAIWHYFTFSSTVSRYHIVLSILRYI